MANKLTLAALQENMRVRLQAFNDEKVRITNNTLHNEVLAADDGFRTAPSSMTLYRGAINWIIWRNGGKGFRWPNGWMEMSVTELAEFIMSKQEA